MRLIAQKRIFTQQSLLSTGVDAVNDECNRFQPFGTPPGKQGDDAYLLNIVRSLDSTGTGACILPHGVLFRGNAEAVMRKKLIRSSDIKGIIGLPANLFYAPAFPLASSASINTTRQRAKASS